MQQSFYRACTLCLNICHFFADTTMELLAAKSEQEQVYNHSRLYMT